MRVSVLIVVLFGWSLLVSGQKEDKKIRDAAIDNVGAVLFDAKSKAMRAQLNTFENNASIKLHYKVDEQSLDQLGGLSEYLLKIFQSVTSPVYTNAKSITGEFSFIENGKLSGDCQYSSHVTKDLSLCLYPDTILQKLDLLYSNYLKSSGNTPSGAGEKIDVVLSDAISHYSSIRRLALTSCDTSANYDKYNEHVTHTSVDRKTSWQTDISELSRLLVGQNMLMALANPSLQGNAMPGVYGGYLITPNNAIDKCSAADLESSSAMLFNRTGIRYYYITADLAYFIPADSLQLFANQVTEQLFSKYPSEKFIVAIWLKLTDNVDKAETKYLLVSQNGSYLNRADVEFARLNSGGSYRQRARIVYSDVYRNIPKPLIICYQVAKANGLFSTSYFQKKGLIKGKQAIYTHVFKIDRALYELKKIREDIQAETANNQNEFAVPKRLLDLQHAYDQKLIEATLKPDLVEAHEHFKQSCIAKTENAQAAALKWLQKEFGGAYSAKQYADLVEQSGMDDNYAVGSCENESGDEIADALTMSSLILSAVELDFIPDALAVLYFADKGDAENAALSATSLFVPGNLQAFKKTIRSTDEIVFALNHGAKVVYENGVLKKISAEQDALLRAYNIPANGVPGLPQKIENNLSITNELLPMAPEQALMYRTVNELPTEKRIEFINKFYDDPSFKQKCLDDVGEVWKWAGFAKYRTSEIAKITGFSDNLKSYLQKYSISKEEFLSMQQKAYQSLAENEKTIVTNIRNEITDPDQNTLLSKAIPKEDIQKYLSGNYQEIGGFVTTAQDSKHLKNFEDLYYGLRLDYTNTKFKLSDGSCGIIRYKVNTPNVVKARYPSITGDLPYTGSGFTGASNGRIGVPEWNSTRSLPNDGAELWEKFLDGTEKLRGIYSVSKNKFIIVK